MKTRHHFVVQWGDTDAAGIVFYPNFYKWMDESINDLFKQLDISLNRLFDVEKIAIPQLECFCQFRKPLRFEDPFIIENKLELLKEKTFKVSHTFILDGQVIAEGYSIRCWTDFSFVPKAIPIPDFIKEKIESYVPF